MMREMRMAVGIFCCIVGCHEGSDPTGEPRPPSPEPPTQSSAESPTEPPAQSPIAAPPTGFVGHLPVLSLPAAVDLDGDGTVEEIALERDGRWRVGDHLVDDCTRCTAAHVVDLDPDDGARELILYGVADEEANEVVFIRYGADRVRTHRWVTSDGEITLEPFGRLVVDRCGSTREVYALSDGGLVLERRMVYEHVRGDCPG